VYEKVAFLPALWYQIRRKSFAAILALTCALIVSVPEAQGTVTHPSDPCCARIPAEFVLRAQSTRAAIQVDGILEEMDWQRATVVSHFIQYEPVEGAEPSFQTEVRILYGQTALYIGAVLFDDEPQKISRILGRRDVFNRADWFTVAIDSYHDRKSAYSFSVNAAGVQMDGIRTRGLDTSWDAVWDSAVRLTDEGWTVEMRIPYSMLRFNEAPSQTWGISFRRTIPRLGETNEWPVMPRHLRRSGEVAFYGELRGLEEVRPRRNFQISPYTVGRLQLAPGDDGIVRSGMYDAGADLKLSLNAATTLDLTINPDFGQVESDPASLNLSAFETIHREQRPFFVEGLQIFDFDVNEGSLLYTRRIGGAAPVIGAAKLSGRTDGGFSFGGIAASSGREFDPERQYGAVRLKQEIGEQSYVGLMTTVADRSVSTGLARRSYTGGLDWDWRFLGNTYSLSGFTAASHVQSGSAEPALGAGGSVKFERLEGNWNYNVGAMAYDARFNLNDLGRVRRNDIVRLTGNLGGRINNGEPVGPLRRMTLNVSSWQNFSFEDRIDQGFGTMVRTSLMTHNFERLELNGFVDYLLGGYDIYETRGLGPVRQPVSYSLRAAFETDSRSAFRIEPSIRLAGDDDGGRRLNAGLSSQWNASPRVSLSGGMSYNHEDNNLSWTANESFRRTGDGWQIGKRAASPGQLAADAFVDLDHDQALNTILDAMTPWRDSDMYYASIFGTRDTRSIDFTLRSNLTFSPDLSLQLFSQFFVARTLVDDFHILQDRDTVTPIEAYPKHHDFSIGSLTANAVFRWEYRPGSRLFVVWSQNRRGREAMDLFGNSSSPYHVPTARHITDTLDLLPTNVFMIKLNYLILN
jgi:hypothetical protein